MQLKGTTGRFNAGQPGERHRNGHQHQGPKDADSLKTLAVASSAGIATQLADKGVSFSTVATDFTKAGDRVAPSLQDPD